MIKFLFRHNKDYSRFNIIKELTKNIKTNKDIYILLPFSKNQFFKNFLKKDNIINDFFISNYDTYVYDRKKITKKNPRAWWKYFQDWFNFKFSKYLLSDTQAHFDYWEKLFGKFTGKHLVLPVLADKSIYFPSLSNIYNDKKIKILFYGSFIPLHGIDIILKAFSLMEKNNINFEATIIGKGQIFPQMKDLYNMLNLKNVTMDGKFIDEKELAEEIRKNDIILGIFGNSKKARSVIPNKVYQSTASKKCTVTMNSEVLKEFYNDEDLITCINTAESLSNTLEELIKKPDKIETIAINGHKQFNYIYKETEKNFEKFIKNI
jgi:glycosyltransferase involved in cell wall biosynthesis